MFFNDERSTLFRPLVGKYREQFVECLQALYTQLYSATADYRQSQSRDQIIESFQEAIQRACVMDEDADNEFVIHHRGEREQASWIFNQLIEHGWLDRLHDPVTLQSTYAFTRVGRIFTQPMVDTAGGRFRTRHRNTRNTRNALSSFLENGEAYDLLDAFEYSERIISDFSDVISELDERKRQLVKEVESQQVVQRASDEFFDFMEKRFMPDLSIRLSADSVEKYRDEIQMLVTAARRKRKEFKVDAERELRKVAPELITDPKRSLYLMVLDGIESRMHGAAEVMLPAMRIALNSFTRRADIIIRQLSYSNIGAQNRLVEICQKLSDLPPEEQEKQLQAAGEKLAVLNTGLSDPNALKINAERVRRIVNTSAEEHAEMDKESRKSLFIQQTIEQAFAVNNQDMGQYVLQALGDGKCISSKILPVTNAKELLMSAHAIDLGSAGHQSSEYLFQIDASGKIIETEYFSESDEFMIELKERVEHAE